MFEIMRLTSLLKNKNVKEKYGEAFPTSIFNIKKEILTRPLTTNYSLVGTDFDLNDLKSNELLIRKLLLLDNNK